MLDLRGVPRDLRPPGDPSHELLSVGEALFRVVSEPIFAALPVPAWPRAMVSGLAVRSTDTHGASRISPAVLTLVLRSPLDADGGPALESGQCRVVKEGAPLPHGADAVIPLTANGEASEHLAPHQWSDAWYAVQKPVAPHWNVAAAGSDLSPGALLMDAGTRLTPPRQAALLTAGVTHVRVKRRPRVAIVLAGDRFAAEGSTCEEGQTPDGVSALLRAALAAKGYPAPPVYVLEGPADGGGQWLANVGNAVDSLLPAHDLVIAVGLVDEHFSMLQPGSAQPFNWVPAPIANWQRIPGVQYRAWQAPSGEAAAPASAHPKYFELPNGDRIANDLSRGFPKVASDGNRACILEIRGMPMSVLTAFHACVLPLLDAMEDEGQLSRREALKSPRLSEFNALADPTYEAASRVAPEERYRTYAYHPEWEVPAHGAAWLNGVLVNEAECHSNRDALQLAILDQSTPGRSGCACCRLHSSIRCRSAACCRRRRGWRSSGGVALSQRVHRYVSSCWTELSGGGPAYLGRFVMKG